MAAILAGSEPHGCDLSVQDLDNSVLEERAPGAVAEVGEDKILASTVVLTSSLHNVLESGNGTEDRARENCECHLVFSLAKLNRLGQFHR